MATSNFSHLVFRITPPSCLLQAPGFHELLLPWTVLSHPSLAFHSDYFKPSHCVPSSAIPHHHHAHSCYLPSYSTEGNNADRWKFPSLFSRWVLWFCWVRIFSSTLLQFYKTQLYPHSLFKDNSSVCTGRIFIVSSRMIFVSWLLLT